jgi:hypothetical protein
MLFDYDEIDSAADALKQLPPEQRVAALRMSCTLQELDYIVKRVNDWTAWNRIWGGDDAE